MIKSLKWLILCLYLVTTLSGIARADTVLGDVNADDRIGIEEAIFALRAVAGFQTAPGAQCTFSSYFPTDPNKFCTKTYNWTYGKTGQYTSKIEGFESTPYASGKITGVKVSNPITDGTTGVFYNDHGVIKFLSFNEYYFSSDCSLASHPADWAFCSLNDKMLINQTHYFVKKDFSECVENIQKIYIRVQSVTLQMRTFYPSIIIWYLDLSKQFVSLNLHDKSSLGISLPTYSDTNGAAVTAFDIYGYDTGHIARGDIDASSGSLNTFSELSSISCE